MFNVDRYSALLLHTPTHVGRMNRDDARRRSRAVYPHACGANEVRSFKQAYLIGLPPRMWG